MAQAGGAWANEAAGGGAAGDDCGSEFNFDQEYPDLWDEDFQFHFGQGQSQRGGQVAGQGEGERNSADDSLHEHSFAQWTTISCPKEGCTFPCVLGVNEDGADATLQNLPDLPPPAGTAAKIVFDHHPHRPNLKSTEYVRASWMAGRQRKKMKRYFHADTRRTNRN